MRKRGKRKLGRKCKRKGNLDRGKSVAKTLKQGRA
jgi:hypothetical protein